MFTTKEGEEISADAERDIAGNQTQYQRQQKYPISREHEVMKIQVQKFQQLNFEDVIKILFLTKSVPFLCKFTGCRGATARSERRPRELAEAPFRASISSSVGGDGGGVVVKAKRPQQPRVGKAGRPRLVFLLLSRPLAHLIRP